jgi:acetyltransferase
MPSEGELVETSSKSIVRRAAPLDVFFRPRNVAVIGATEDPTGVGRSLVSNLKQTPFGGSIYPVNPRHSIVLGMPCYPSVREVPAMVDLAVIATPARTVPAIVRECVAAGVEGAIIISAGFKEIGEKGIALEREVLAEARKSKIRIVGPNCLGIMSPHYGLNATFASSMARPGHLGFISQSGALCTAILDWSQRELVGFSAFVSVGSMLDVGWADLIQYLGDDPKTHSIVIYMESVGDARAFLSAAREVALSKPIIVIKPGRTAAAARAAASHTGALTGQDDVLDAAFRRCGVVRVNTIAELFYLSEALDKQPRPKGPRLTIVTNAGGPAVLATDALLSDGGQLAELSPATIEQLSGFLPRHWSHQNPIDMIGDANAERYAKTVDVAVKDPATDGLLVIMAPTGLADPAAIAEQLAHYAKLPGKPVIASWMGGRDIAKAEAILNQAGIPTYGYPDAAARVFDLMWSYSANLKALYETPEAFEPEAAASRTKATELINGVREKGRTLLTEAESKSLLAIYGIPTVATEIAATAEQAVDAAGRIGYPVVLKLHSETITHKTDVGGVELNLSSEAAVRTAYQSIQESVKRAAGTEHFLGVTVQRMVRPEGYELILGSSIDSQFGPVLLFGSGGQLVEVYKDSAIGLPPLNTTLARRLMERTKIFSALGGVRGRKPVNLVELEKLLVRFSYLATEQSWIKEIDINPLLASAEGILALDARVVLHGRDVVDPPSPAIRPYPVQYVRPWRFEDGTEVIIRPIRPEDEPLIVAFHAKLSERSIYQRYFHLLSLDQRVSHDRLVRVCFGDYNREIALVAEHRDPVTRAPEILAVGRLSKAHLANEAELAFLITDENQGRGLGTELSRRLIEIARIEKLARVTVEILGGNWQMIEVCRPLGFDLEHVEDGVVHGVLTL